MLLTNQSLPTTPLRRRRLLLVAAGIRRLVNGWVAAAIVRHERRAALHVLRRLDDRALKDVGLNCSGIDCATDRAARCRLRSRANA